MITSGGTTTLGLYDNVSEIGKKADITYVNVQDSLKADKTYVDTALSSLSTEATKFYQTLALANADIVNLAVNQAVNIGESANGGLWYKAIANATTLTKSVYDPLTQSKKYTDDKTKFVSAYRSVNIADLSTVTNGKYVAYTDGTLNTNTDFVATDFYEVLGNTEYQVPVLYDQQFAFYDVNKVYISGLVRADMAGKFNTPASAKYVRFSVQKMQLSMFMLAKSSEYPAVYTPYSINLQALNITTNQVNNLFKDVRDDLGFKTVNIVDTTKVTTGRYVDFSTGILEPNATFSVTNLIEVNPSTEYQTSSFYDQQFAFYNATGVHISGQAYPINSKFTTPSNAKYARFSIQNDQLNTLMISESSIFPNYYVPYGVKTIEDFIFGDTKTTEIFVSADVGDTSAQFTGKNAIQLALDSITDAADKNRYRIIAKGVFKVDKASDYIGYRGYPAMILAKDNVEIVGDGNTVVSAELPYNDADIGLSVNGGNYPRIRYQTLYTYAENALIKGIRFIAKNIRYAIHLDNPNGANKRHDFKDVSFIFKGDKGSQQALGCGTSTGEETYFDGGECHSDVGMPLYCHNNSKFVKPSIMSFKDYSFSSNVGKYALNLQNDGSLVKDKVELIGCSFAGSAYVVLYDEAWLRKNTDQKYDSFDHAEWTFTGYGNDPFLFENNVGGLSLRFKTTGVGTDKTIRFDKTASGYALLIKNNQANTDVSLYLDNRDYIDGYIVQDGSVGLPAQALGCKDVSEVAGLYDSGVIYTSLGKRLGNCSGVNKVLRVIINGATSTITFNKDYTAMSNAAILAEINAALSGATADLYSYGRDYYPMMPDVAETVYNSGAAYIPKGSVVAKSGGTVQLANGNDKVYGVALDDIPVMRVTSEGARKGCGRVLKRGYIYANPTKAHFVLADNQNPAVGKRFSVSNGQLVTDANGKISVDIDTGIVSINC